MPWLVADVGGTNARFGLVRDRSQAITEVETIAVAAHAGLGDAAQAYLAGRSARPQHAAIAVATPVTSDAVAFTNSPWSFSRAALARELNLSRLTVLNDFEALALSLPTLTAAQLIDCGPAAAPKAMMAVVGPGTGLGVAGVLQTPDGWQALPCEGGHVTLAAANDFESEILQYLRRRFTHVSAERVLSGIGLPNLYEAIANVRGGAAQSAGQGLITVMTGREIVIAGLAKTDAVADEALDVFCAMLGGVCGNAALTMNAIGGVYVGGGIVPRLGARFFASQFRTRFEAKGRFEPFLKTIPSPVITDTLAALSGAALAVAQSGD